MMVTEFPLQYRKFDLSFGTQAWSIKLHYQHTACNAVCRTIFQSVDFTIQASGYCVRKNKIKRLYLQNHYIST